MNKKRIFGISLIILSGVLSFSKLTFTGAVIGTPITNYLSILAVGFFIAGILLILNSAKKLEVYVGQGSHKGEQYVMTDPELYFSKDGIVKLRDFDEQIKLLRQDPELLGMVRTDYEPELRAIRDSDDKFKTRVAESFLKVLLGADYKPKEAPVSNKELLSKEEEQGIRKEFDKGWKNHPNSAQYRVLKTHGLDYVPGKSGGHGKIYSVEHPEIFASTSSSPGDTNAGRNIGRDVVKIIKESKKKS